MSVYRSRTVMMITIVTEYVSEVSLLTSTSPVLVSREEPSGAEEKTPSGGRHRRLSKRNDHIKRHEVREAKPWHVQCEGSPADWGVVVQARGEDGDEGEEEGDKDVTIISVDSVADHAPTPLQVRLRGHPPCVLTPCSLAKRGDRCLGGAWA
jgi:hypothetical protein